jgi:hypothetical protein
VSVTATGARLAPAARRWLAAASEAWVVHTFTDAAYLVDAGGGVLLVTRPPLGPSPFGLLLQSRQLEFTEAMHVGEAVAVSPGRIAGDGWSIDASTARSWKARPRWGSLRRRPSRLRDGIGVIRGALAERGPRGAFGRGLLGMPPADVPEGVEARLQERAKEGAAQLVAALGSGHGALESAVAALAGLGGGFTPAGDDFLMGAMLACWATRPSVEASGTGRTIAGAASPRTTTASAAWLAAAARGEASWPWHDLVDSLASGDSTGITRSARDILETGHTSGEDALAGFLYSIQPGS